jgi:hypothetical protein
MEMSKSIIVESIITPNIAAPCYGDKIVILDDGELIYHGPCRACPNPYTPSDKKPWVEAYAWIACTAAGIPLEWECVISPKHGKCLLINNGSPVRTRYPNKNHGNYFIATEIEIHQGYSEVWSGSAGCITYPPDTTDIMNFFELSEKGKLSIVDYSKMKGSHETSNV